MLSLNRIHSDKRGEINALVGLELKCDEVTVFKTNKGMARGGCIHPNSSEHICVLSGTILFFYGTLNTRLTAGQSITIKPNTPHYFFSETDSVVIEWGPEIKEKGNRYLEFRKIVDEINHTAV